MYHPRIGPAVPVSTLQVLPDWKYNATARDPEEPREDRGPKRGCYAVRHFQQLDPNHNEHRLIMYFVIWPAYGLGLFFGSWESS